MIKFSIVTATYNSDKVLERAIRSVLAQNYKNYEYIIVDGKSSDDTVEIIEKYAKENSKIKYISEEDLGIYDALNKGVKMSDGDYLVVMGSDDEFINESILMQVAHDLEDDIDFFSAPVMAVLPKYNIETLFSNKNVVPHQGLFVKNEIIKSRLFDLSFKVAADYNFILSCLQDDNITKKFVDYPVMYFTLGGESGINDAIVEDGERLCEKYNLDKAQIPLITGRKNEPFKKLVKQSLEKIGLLKICMILSGKWRKHKDIKWKIL